MLTQVLTTERCIDEKTRSQHKRMAIFFSVERVTGRIIKKRKKYEGYRMAYKKGKGVRKKKRLVNNPIVVSPDGGETVYQELRNGKRKLVEQSQLAKDTEQEMYEHEMVGVDAIKLRRKYPALQKAWDQYKTVWKLVAYND